MKRLALLLSFALFALICHGQRGSTTDPVYTTLKSKYGYISIEYINPDTWCPQGLYLVIDSLSHYGVADFKGSLLIDPTKHHYTKLLPVGKNNCGMDGFYVEIDGTQICMLDTKGNIVTPPIKGTMFQDYLNTVIICLDELGVDASGCFFKTVLDNENDTPVQVSQTLYSAEGIVLGTATGLDFPYYGFGEGLVGVKKGDLWGYMDLHTGEMVIPAQYAEVCGFSKGVAQVRTVDNKILAISNPLKNEGKSSVLASATPGEKHSDIDDNIPQTSRVQENTFALIVANQNYSDFSAPFAINDGKIFQQYCLRTLGIPQSNIMYYEDASINNLNKALERISDLAEVYEGDASFIFYYSGQGFSDPVGNPYLLASDSQLDLVSQTAYSVEQLYRLIGSLELQSAVLLIDAGFNNELRDGKPMKAKQGHPVKVKTPPVVGKTAVIIATSENETAFAYPEQIHGLFTYFLCQKLQQSKGNVTLQELYDYIHKNTEATSYSLFARKQLPKIEFNQKINNKKI